MTKWTVMAVGLAGMMTDLRQTDGAESPYTEITVGEPYPDFLLPALDGGFGRLSDYRGKKVLLIHFASW